jgi:hypothetical protein
MCLSHAVTVVVASVARLLHPRIPHKQGDRYGDGIQLVTKFCHKFSSRLFMFQVQATVARVLLRPFVSQECGYNQCNGGDVRLLQRRHAYRRSSFCGRARSRQVANLPEARQVCVFLSIQTSQQWWLIPLDRNNVLRRFARLGGAGAGSATRATMVCVT